MDYSLLEDAYPDGGDFEERRKTVKESRGEGARQIKRQTNPDASKAVADLAAVLPLNTDSSTSNFGDGGKQVYMYAGKQRPAGIPVQEAFTAQSAGDDMKMKMDKILQMVEQNKTGYEPNSTNDMFLYILTGVMFLFTFDTFVMLGKSMRV